MAVAGGDDNSNNKRENEKKGIWSNLASIKSTGWPMYYIECNQHCCAYVETLIKNPTPIISQSQATTKKPRWRLPPHTSIFSPICTKHMTMSLLLLHLKTWMQNKRTLKQAKKHIHAKLHMCNWLKMQFVAFISHGKVFFSIIVAVLDAFKMHWWP